MIKLIEFGASNCMPCKIMKPILNELKEEGYNIEQIDLDEDPDKAKEYDIVSVPTFIIYEDDKVKEIFTGALPKEKLKEKLNE